MGSWCKVFYGKSSGCLGRVYQVGVWRHCMTSCGGRVVAVQRIWRHVRWCLLPSPSFCILSVSVGDCDGLLCADISIDPSSYPDGLVTGCLPRRWILHLLRVLPPTYDSPLWLRFCWHVSDHSSPVLTRQVCKERPQALIDTARRLLLGSTLSQAEC